MDHLRVQMGITSFAVRQLGEVIQAEWPEPGMQVKARQSIGTVESVKTVSDLYAPVQGMVLEVNLLLIDNIDLINRDPEGDGWIAELKLEDPNQLKLLLSHEEYETWINEGE